MTKRNTYVEGIQTGERDVTADIAVMRISQTPYGMVNGEVHLETFSFAKVDGSELDDLKPTSRMTLDTIGARKLINELCIAFNLPSAVELKRRVGVRA